jgi:hypothetical protein
MKTGYSMILFLESSAPYQFALAVGTREEGWRYGPIVKTMVYSLHIAQTLLYFYVNSLDSCVWRSCVEFQPYVYRFLYTIIVVSSLDIILIRSPATGYVHGSGRSKCTNRFPAKVPSLHVCVGGGGCSLHRPIVQSESTALEISICCWSCESHEQFEFKVAGWK